MKLGQFDSQKVSILGDCFHSRKSRQNEKAYKKNARRILDFFRQIREHLEPSEEERNYPFLFGREGFPDLLDIEFQPIGCVRRVVPIAHGDARRYA